MVNERSKANLISLADRTTIEQRKIAQKGGVASGEARREKKNLKMVVQDILNMNIASKKEKQTLCKNLGITFKDGMDAMTHRVHIAAKMVRQAEEGKAQQQKMVGEFDDSFVPAPTDKHVYEINLNIQNNKIAQLVEGMSDD